MKYTKEERLDIGRRIYEGKFSRYTAAEAYVINKQTARNNLRMYRDINHLPPKCDPRGLYCKAATYANTILRIAATMVLIAVLSSCSAGCFRAPEKSEATSTVGTSAVNASVTETSELVPIAPTETTLVKSVPTVPDGPDFDVDFSRALEIIAGRDNVIITGNGKIHVIDGYAIGSSPAYDYNDAGIGWGTGRFVVEDLEEIQYSIDRSVVGLIIADHTFKKPYGDNPQGDLDAGKLIVYDGTNETVIAQDVLSFSLSADGKRVAYLSGNKTQANGDNLFIYSVENKESSLLSDSSGPSYAFSPTGKSVVYTEYYDAGGDASWRVFLKSEEKEKIALTDNQYPIAVSDNGSYAYVLEKVDEGTYKIWVFSNGQSTCMTEPLIFNYRNPTVIMINNDCSQLLYYSEQSNLIEVGKSDIRLDMKGSIDCSTAFFHNQYLPEMHGLSARYVFSDSLINVIHGSSDQQYVAWPEKPEVSFVSFNEQGEVCHYRKEEVYILYEGLSEYTAHIDMLTDKNDNGFTEAIFRREGEPDVKYFLDIPDDDSNDENTMTAEQRHQAYIEERYFDLYMVEEPYDTSPVKVAEHVSQVWADEYGVYYICLEEISANLMAYFKNPDRYTYETEEGVMVYDLYKHDLFDVNALFFSTDTEKFTEVAYTRQYYMDIGFG